MPTFDEFKLKPGSPFTSGQFHVLEYEMTFCKAHIRSATEESHERYGCVGAFMVLRAVSGEIGDLTDELPVGVLPIKSVCAI